MGRQIHIVCMIGFHILELRAVHVGYRVLSVRQFELGGRFHASRSHFLPQLSFGKISVRWQHTIETIRQGSTLVQLLVP